MVCVGDVVAVLDRWAPVSWAESGDRVGLRVGRLDAEVRVCVVALDLTGEVVEEAVRLGAQLIVTHHPFWYRDPVVLDVRLDSVRVLGRLVAQGISVVAMHTNLDRAEGGVNDVLARCLGLRNVRALAMEGGRMHYVRVGELWGSRYRDWEVFLSAVAGRLGARGLRHNWSEGVWRRLVESEVWRVAVCGGSGGRFWRDVWLAGAQVYVTADVSYHVFLDSRDLLWVIDAGHFETEVHVLEAVARYLREQFPELSVEVLRSKELNPVKWFGHE